MTSHGAKITFTGVVRDQNHGRHVLAVEYDAFLPLMNRVFNDIAEEAKQQWGADMQIEIQHRTGKLLVGETSVFISVSSVHRDESYQASRYIIEQIKIRAPIWKKEYYVDGESEWLQGHALCQHSTSPF